MSAGQIDPSERPSPAALDSERTAVMAETAMDDLRVVITDISGDKAEVCIAAGGSFVILAFTDTYTMDYTASQASELARALLAAADAVVAEDGW